MSCNSLRSKLIADSNNIYRKYYSNSIPITKMGGGIGHEVDLAIESVSDLNRTTKQGCYLYFSINSVILSYLQEKGREVSRVYAKSAPRFLGSTFSIEQLLADEISKEIFLVIVSVVTTKLIDKVPLFKEKVSSKLTSILKRKTKDNLNYQKIKQHAEGLAIHVIDSPNVKININKIYMQKKKHPRQNITQRKRKKRRIIN